MRFAFCDWRQRQPQAKPQAELLMLCLATTPTTSKNMRFAFCDWRQRQPQAEKTTSKSRTTHAVIGDNANHRQKYAIRIVFGDNANHRQKPQAKPQAELLMLCLATTPTTGIICDSHFVIGDNANHKQKQNYSCCDWRQRQPQATNANHRQNLTLKHSRFLVPRNDKGVAVTPVAA